MKNSSGLNPDLLDVDVWRFVDTLREAAATADSTTKVTLLRHAVEADSRGLLAHGHDYDWIDQPREKLRRYAIQVRLELADLLAADQPRAASDLVCVAATLDPIKKLSRNALCGPSPASATLTAYVPCCRLCGSPWKTSTRNRPTRPSPWH